MANKKNKKNNHRQVYRKKKLPRMRASEENREEHKTEQNTDTDTEEEVQTVSFDGSRIINLDKLQQYTDDLTKHATTCAGSVTLSGETRGGLASILTAHCTTCQHTIRFETSKKVKGPRGYHR